MKGRLFLGLFSGFFFGLLLGPTLFMWGVLPLASPLMWMFPLLGILLGMIMAAWAPFGSGPEPASAPVAAQTAPERAAAAEPTSSTDDHTEEE